MTTVIVGAGSVGGHIAQMLSSQGGNVVVVDVESRRLDRLAQSSDIATRIGDGTDWRLLEGIVELEPSHLLAVTDRDDTNLVACSIAKQLGYPTTIARVQNRLYFEPSPLDFGRIFDVDHFIGPNWLAAQEVARMVTAPGALFSQTFAHGVVQLRTYVIPKGWKRGGRPLIELPIPSGAMVGLIRRTEEKGYRVIFPHGRDSLEVGDEVTFIGEADVMEKVADFLGVKEGNDRGVTMAAGSLPGVRLAQILSAQGVDVRLIEKSEQRCEYLSELLPGCTIMHHESTDIDFLKAEKIGARGPFVACTPRDELNLLACSLAVEAGVSQTVAFVRDRRYESTFDHVGVSRVVSPRSIAADRVMAICGSGSVSSMVSLYENQAEILEVKVSQNSRLVGIPLVELGPRLPSDFLIAVIQNRGRVMIAHGKRVLSPGDTMIVITHPRHIDQFQEIF